MGRIHWQTLEEEGVEIVDWDEADIICIATPDKYHGEQTIEALQHGKHVFCEKPLCRTMTDLADIRLYPDQHVGQNYPLRHVFEKLEDQDDFGDLQIFAASYSWGRHHKMETTWRKDDPNYSLIFGGLIHVVDLFFHVVGGEIHFHSAASHGKHHELTVALCHIPHGLAFFQIDGLPGQKEHHHAVGLTMANRTIAAVNKDPTDKTACLRAFIDDIRQGKEPNNDFRAVELCLQIENFVATSQNR